MDGTVSNLPYRSLPGRSPGPASSAEIIRCWLLYRSTVPFADYRQRGGEGLNAGCTVPRDWSLTGCSDSRLLGALLTEQAVQRPTCTAGMEKGGLSIASCCASGLHSNLLCQFLLPEEAFEGELEGVDGQLSVLLLSLLSVMVEPW